DLLLELRDSQGGSIYRSQLYPDVGPRHLPFAVPAGVQIIDLDTVYYLVVWDRDELSGADLIVATGGFRGRAVLEAGALLLPVHDSDSEQQVATLAFSIR